MTGRDGPAAAEEAAAAPVRVSHDVGLADVDQLDDRLASAEPLVEELKSTTSSSPARAADRRRRRPPPPPPPPPKPPPPPCRICLHLLELVVGEAGLLEDLGSLFFGRALQLGPVFRGDALRTWHRSRRIAAAGRPCALALALGLGGRLPLAGGSPPLARRRAARPWRRSPRCGLGRPCPWPSPQSFFAASLPVDAEQPRASPPRSSATIGFSATTSPALRPLVTSTNLSLVTPSSTSVRSKPFGRLDGDVVLALVLEDRLDGHAEDVVELAVDEDLDLGVHPGPEARQRRCRS